MKNNLLAGAHIPEIDWPTLIPLGHHNLPNLNLNLLPDWAGRYAHALSQATETPPELAGGMILATCATAMARCFEVSVNETHSELCNLWIVTALPPGNRKSSVQNNAAKPLALWEQEQQNILEPEIKRITSERAILEARIKHKRQQAAKKESPEQFNTLKNEITKLELSLPEIPICPRLWTSDSTPERLGSMLADYDECMGWLSSEGGIFDILQGRYNKILNLDLILKSHSGDPEKVDRAGRPPVHLQTPRLTIGLSPQPDILRSLASTPGFRGRGLIGRFLYFLPSSNLGYRTLNTTPIPKSIEIEYMNNIKNMLNWKIPCHGQNQKNSMYKLQVSKEALQEHGEYAKYVEKSMRPGEEMEHFTDWAGKAPGAAIRLAGVLHGIKHTQTNPWEHEITKETMDSALEIMAIISKHSLAALDLMGADSTIAGAKYILEWIYRNKKPSFTARDIFNALRSRFPKMDYLNEALDILNERGYVHIHESETQSTGRPPSPTIIVRPAIQGSW